MADFVFNAAKGRGIYYAGLPTQQAGQRWCRLDVVSAASRRTAIYGWLTVIDG